MLKLKENLGIAWNTGQTVNILILIRPLMINTANLDA